MKKINIKLRHDQFKLIPLSLIRGELKYYKFIFDSIRKCYKCGHICMDAFNYAKEFKKDNWLCCICYKDRRLCLLCSLRKGIK